MRNEQSASRRLAVLTELARSAVKAPTAGEIDRGLAVLRARTKVEARPPSLRRGLLVTVVLSLAVSGLAVIVALLLGGSNVSVSPVLVSRVEGGKILEGGYLSEVGHAGVRLHFSEGSKFLLAPGTRGRLRAVSAEGARLALDHGSASFQITRNPDRRWWVEAGPFVVEVQGTEFTVTWEPTSEEFEVELRQGRVVVSGPLVGDELTLRPGQSLNVSLANRETVISERPSQRPPEPVASGVVPPAVAPAGPLPSAAPPVPSGRDAVNPDSSGGRRWREALANGQWDRILADVEHEGVEASLRTLSSDELFALADAARYRRRPDLARGALLAQRSRFPSSPRALDAVFLLGRVEEMRAGGKAAALERYDEYLARAPAGTYAAEALGRTMILVKEMQGPARAREVAREYLRRFPNGSYAEAAQSLARAP